MGYPRPHIAAFCYKGRHLPQSAFVAWLKRGLGETTILERTFEKTTAPPTSNFSAPKKNLLLEAPYVAVIHYKRRAIPVGDLSISVKILKMCGLDHYGRVEAGFAARCY